MDFETSELKLRTGLVDVFDIVASFSVDSIVALCGVVIGFLIALMAVAFITRNRE